MPKTAAQARKGRLYRQIVHGLSWSNEIRVQVPPALWALIKDGWHAGPCVKSMSDIADPNQPGVKWTAWMFGAVFGTDCIYIQSSAMPANQFISLRDVAAESLSGDAGDWPTRGV